MTALVEVKELDKAFGGVHAVEGVSFAVEAGQVFSVIGPNGAGKTTLFNLITGLYTPTKGEILLNGESTAKLEPNQLAERGMCRTFQQMQICMNMTAIENVMLGRHLHLKSSLFTTLFRLPSLRRNEAAARERAADLMKYVGCGNYLNSEASAMSYGALKRLEIARALAAEPKVILLDEPAAGLNAVETSALEELIRKIAEQGITVMLVEHDMKLVMNISDRLLVLNYGRVLTQGTPEEIRQNPEVIAAYLGGSCTQEQFGGRGLKHADRVTAPHAKKEMLSIKGLATSYGQIEALHDIDVRINSGEIVSLVGANGAGKSTLLMTISGLQPTDGGTITFEGKDLAKVPADQRVADGIVQVPEGRQVFKNLSVHDNLLLGAYSRGKTPEVLEDLERIYTRFPILRQKRHNLAGELSGGQQQMLAMGRALMAKPRLLLMDEPSMGLAPLIIEEIFNIVKELKEEGITIFLVEQNASQALALADRGYVLETGKVVVEGTGRELLSNEKVREAYLGM
ncbi:MAG: ATP-binding cassette domain-containing protein [Marinobacter sp.]|uniref:ATP-binding cassette domain-containing protein n=1 Tax=Marinobacter sp. TaxID=50741 RepID=UPI0034A09A13